MYPASNHDNAAGVHGDSKALVYNDEMLIVAMLFAGLEIDRFVSVIPILDITEAIFNCTELTLSFYSHDNMIINRFAVVIIQQTIKL